MQSGCEGTLKERHVIQIYFKLGKNAAETYGMLQTAFWASCIGSVAFPPGQYTSPQFHPCHRLFDQDGHQDSSSASL